MLYNGVFGCHGNTCYVIFIDAILYMLYSIGTDRYFDKEHFETNQKSLRLPVQKLWLK